MLEVSDRPWRLLSVIDEIDPRELPGAAECCDFGGTFSAKNAEASTTMVADETASIHVMEAEFVTAGDASCLLDIGSTLRRQNSGVHTIHMTEILTSTKEIPFGVRNHQEAFLRGEQ